jgi:hypothetical protein
MRIISLILAALTAGVLAGGFLMAGRRPSPGGLSGSAVDRRPAARVGETVIYQDQISLAGSGPGADAWVEDELLAQLAVERGLENPAATALVMARARQLHLRDAILEYELDVDPPTEQEIIAMMRSDSVLYMVERHYFEILAADSATAESVMTILAAGRSFQVTAEHLSMGQKAAIGGDMGFLTGGELVGRGLPDRIGRLEGLDGPVPSGIGWHIFLVTETRPLTDTARVMESLSGVYIANERREAVEALLAEARAGREVEVDHQCWR